MKQSIKIFSILALALFVLSACKSDDYTTNTGGVKGNNSYSGDGGEMKEVEVEGIAQITSSGRQDAYDRALQHAFRKAVEQVLGTMVSSETMSDKGILIKDEITSKSTGFVARYQVLSDEVVEGNTEVVKAKVWVVVGDVKENAEALGLLQDNVGRPYVLVLIDEPSIVDGSPLNNAKIVLQNELKKKSFEFVQEEQLKVVMQRYNQDTEDLVEQENEAALLEIMEQLGVQVLIKGTVVSSKQSVGALANTDFVSVRSTLNLEVVEGASARVISSVSYQSPGSMIDEQSAQTASIRAAANKAADEVIDNVITEWGKLVNEGFEYTVTIEGVGFLDTGAIVEDLNKNIEGIKKVIERPFDSANNRMVVLVRYTGQASQLARMLVTPDKISIPLEYVSATSKDIKLQRK